jgi:hypothetical protein
MPAPAALDPEARRWRVAAYVATFGAAGSFMAGICLWFHFDGTRPHAADTTTGRVYPLNTHGAVVYLNAHEHWVLTGLFAVFVVLGVIGFLIDRWQRPFKPTWER